jgi:TPR repeat protein
VPRSPAAPLLVANRAPVAENSGVPGTVGDGSDELAVAQSYLNGRHGAPRDSTEAVRWLWRSVAKQNATATLLLSDFYLRGDGVSKSCDQARLLLDAAARKGKAAAGERLRNLEAFGCQ